MLGGRTPAGSSHTIHPYAIEIKPGTEEKQQVIKVQTIACPAADRMTAADFLRELNASEKIVDIKGNEAAPVAWECACLNAGHQRGFCIGWRGRHSRGSIFLLFMVLDCLHLSPERSAMSVALALGINPLRDMFETACNVAGNNVGTYIISKRLKMIEAPSEKSES